MMGSLLNSRWKKLAAGLLALLAAYGLGSLALDTGSYWQYLGMLVLLIAGIRWLLRGIRNQ